MHFKAFCNGLPMPLPNQQLRVTDEVTHPELKTLLRVIRLTSFLLLAAFLQVSARGYSQTVTLREKSAPLETIFSAIEKQTGFKFYYRLDLLDSAKRVDINVRNAPLTEALDQCVTGQAFTYEIIEKTIVLKPKSPAAEEHVPSALPPGEVHGRLTNEDGEPVPGATVKVKGTNIGTTTNADGEFHLTGIDKEITLLFTGTNIETEEIKVNGKTDIGTLNVRTKITSLNEVVINKGYYSTMQRLNTGNVTRVEGKTIQQQPVSDPMMALEGRVPGLYISQGSGIPGAALTVQLRGRNSISNGNNPLYIVDGIPFTSTSLTNTSIGGGALGSPPNGLNQGMSPFNSLNPADIESIEVLKDADATAIYGSRGANGVILITTKKGKAGTSKVEVNVYTGMGRVTSQMKLLNTGQYLAMRQKAFYNDSIADPAAYTGPGETDYDVNGVWDTTRYTDWQKKLIGGTANFTNAQASLSGGTKNTQFMLNGGYSKQTTVFPGHFSDGKASVHFNINHVSANQRFRALFSAQYVNDNSVLPQADFTGQITLAPDAPALYDANGKINWENGTWANPMAITLQSAKAIAENIIGNLNLGYELAPGLILRASLGYTHIQMDQTNQSPATANYGPPSPYVRTNFFAKSEIKTWIIEPQANYIKTLGQGKLDVLVGSTFQENIQQSLGQLALGFSSDALIPNISAASLIYVLDNTYSNYHYGALFGRINYNWREKYLVNITGRRDGSSRFGPGKRFGNFAAIGAGWIFSNEAFISNNLPFLSFGKLRASYGTTGNDQITDYQYISTYLPYSNSTYQGVTGLYPSKLANPYFSWEMVRKLEIGMELGFLKDRIFVLASYYRNRTNNQLVGQPLPSIVGFTSIQANLPALIQNSGVEFQLNTVNFHAKDFQWTTSFNISIPRNKLIAFPDLINNSNYRDYYAVGKSLFARSAFHMTGVNPQTGLYAFEDVNKDGQITFSQDRKFDKEVAQNFYGGLGNTLIYKNWTLDFLFQFVKQTGLNYMNNFLYPGLFNQNQPVEVLNAWQGPGQISSIQQYTTNSGTPAGAAYINSQQSDIIVSDASFIRLKNVYLAYSLAQQTRSRLHLQQAKVFVQAQNLFTITNYQGLDPESQGLTLPPLRMIAVGIQVAL